jgi:osmoprotectant transport system ATP-binding protein
LQIDVPLRLLTHPADPYVAELTDASDVMRRLGLMSAGEAATAGGHAGVDQSAPHIDARSSLREALGRMLLDGEPVVVTENGQPHGVLRFANIAAALRA